MHRVWEENRQRIVDEGDNTWHLLSNTPHIQYTQYCKEIEVHWMTRLFVAHAMEHKHDNMAILLTKMFELKKEVDAIKEVLHHLGRKFGDCLFLIPMNDLDAIALPLSSTSNEGGLATKRV